MARAERGTVYSIFIAGMHHVNHRQPAMRGLPESEVIREMRMLEERKGTETEGEMGLGFGFGFGMGSCNYDASST